MSSFIFPREGMAAAALGSGAPDAPVSLIDVTLRGAEYAPELLAQIKIDGSIYYRDRPITELSREELLEAFTVLLRTFCREHTASRWDPPQRPSDASSSP